MNRTTVGIGVDFHITCFQTISLLEEIAQPGGDETVIAKPRSKVLIRNVREQSAFHFKFPMIAQAPFGFDKQQN